MPELTPTFEQSMQELEEIVTRLEQGGLPLEETLALFERGQALAALCNEALDKAELRLQQLRPTATGSFEPGPLDAPED
jgi:exodeoxyribonuclease VII small subunit